MDKEYCPDCVVELITTRHNPDSMLRTIWLKCPKCGLEKRPETEHERNKALDEFRDAHKLSSTANRSNLNKYF